MVAALWTPWYLLSAGVYALGLLAADAAVAAGMGKITTVKKAQPDAEPRGARLSLRRRAEGVHLR